MHTYSVILAYLSLWSYPLAIIHDLHVNPTNHHLLRALHTVDPVVRFVQWDAPDVIDDASVTPIFQTEESAVNLLALCLAWVGLGGCFLRHGWWWK